MKTATPEELQDLGKRISRDFITTNRDMNESLQKVAQEYNLNRHQIARVAETANVETYLKLIDRSEDKYLEYPLADATKVANTILEKDASEEFFVSMLDDFNQYADIKHDVTNFSLDMYENVRNDKTVLPEPNQEAVKLAHAQRLSHEVDMNRAYLEEQFSLLGDLEDGLYDLVKQAHLQEVPFEDLQSIVKTAAPRTFDYLYDMLTETLKVERPYLEFNKIAESTDNESFIDHNSKMYKYAEAFDLQLEKVQALANGFENALKDLNDFATSNGLVGLKKEAGVVGGAIDFIKKHPALTAAAVTYPIAYMYGKERGEQAKAQEFVFNREAAMAASPRFGYPKPITEVI